MAYTKESINKLFDIIVKELDISNEMFQKAKTEYEALGNWINHNTEYDVSIYSQGSFALGTVVKPISGKDDYDLDLVCELSDRYGLSARQLKLDVVKPWLEEYKRITSIKEKRRCWHVEYDEIPNFHMDVIPAYATTSPTYINITDHNEDNDEYTYCTSNPKGYEQWFYSRCQNRWDALFEQYSKDNHLSHSQAEIEKLDRHKIKTPLQQAVQILKRHRDIMFKDLSDNRRKEKPISIIITTIAAQLYENEDNITDTLNTFLYGAEEYIESNKKDGMYYIENPSFEGENFANKWNEHPERADAFIKWIRQAKTDLGYNSMLLDERIGMGKRIKKSFGEDIGNRVFESIAASTTADVISGTAKVDASTGVLSKTGTINIKSNHHYHAKISEE